MFTRIVFAGVVMIGLLGINRVAQHDAQRQSMPDRRERPTADVNVGPGDLPDVEGAEAAVLAAFYQEQEHIEQERVAEAERVAAEQAAAAEAARVEAARQTSRPAPASSGSRGAHSDAWWQGVAVCEQGGRNDPFYGFFSIMDGSAGGRDWSTQVGMANAIIGRYGDSAWAASCVAAGYRASPGG